LHNGSVGASLEADFANLIRRVRAGDAAAAEEIVRRYESAVRAVVRARLFDPGMRRQFDSMDICQSVLASFFVRVAAGQFELERPAQLVALLTKMAQNKLAWHVRYHLQQRRDIRRGRPDLAQTTQPASSSSDPARRVEAKELLERAWQSMDHELREIASRRLEGQSWDQVARAIGGTAGARRMQFERGLNEIAEQIGIEEATCHGR
jgi:RNA polymerase sigma-70 factor (ECF subfamily)